MDELIRSSRQSLTASAAAALRNSGVLAEDNRRRRSRYFDGRFYAARDVIREQQYSRVRLTDLAMSLGSGVIRGLHVTLGSDGQLVISAGHGLTGSGEPVVIASELRLSPASVPEQQKVDSVVFPPNPPKASALGRTGLFVLALRAVEFTANPIAAYPTTIDGPRSVQDGDIIEATVVTLIPYPDDGPQADFSGRRAKAALAQFVRREQAPALPATALPLAIVAIDRDIVQWVDEYLVRREVGDAAEDDSLRLGLSGQSPAPPGIARAFVRQYEAHLSEVLTLFKGQESRIAASGHFRALPPCGRFPAATVDADALTQSFFPSSVDVRLSVVPEDEWEALTEEALGLPPIDLTLGDAALVGTAVLALLPIPRAEIAKVLAQPNPPLGARLSSVGRGGIAGRLPLDALGEILRRRLPVTGVPAPAPEVGGDELPPEWKTLLRGMDRLGYVRIRHLGSVGKP